MLVHKAAKVNPVLLKQYFMYAQNINSMQKQWHLPPLKKLPQPEFYQNMTYK